MNDEDGIRLFPDGLPYITTVFDASDNRSTNQLYLAIICQHLKRIVPADFFRDLVENASDRGEVLREFLASLPLLTRTDLKDELPFDLSFYLLCPYRPNAFKFFFEMISRWLVPGKRLNVELLHAVDFRMPDLSDQVFTLCDLMIRVEREEDLETIRRNLPILEAEISLGTSSGYYAQRILENKGLTADEKTTMIQEHIAYLVRRLPRAFDQDVFTEMQYMLVTWRDEFQDKRPPRLLSRIISLSYLFKRGLRESIDRHPDRRHISIRAFKSQLTDSFQSRPVLSLVVGLNFLHDNELLEEPHILRAVRKYIPDATLIEGSFINRISRGERLALVYVELERPDGVEFSHDQIKKLRRELPNDLTDHVEHLMHSVFMPQNEEELMRNILTLGNQLKFVRDLPQVIITFREQTDNSVVFTVVLVSVLKSKPGFVQRRFKKVNSILSYEHDRTKTIGYVRKRYPKEAAVFHVSLPKAKFLRGNHSLDLQKARQVVVSELSGIIGEFRDYNGGMISKQSELFCAFKELITDESARDDDFVLENFFYSLSPTVMRSVLDPGALKELYSLFSIEARLARDRNTGVYLRVHEEPARLFAVVSFEDLSYKNEIMTALQALGIAPIELASTFVHTHGVGCLGLIYRCDDEERRRTFLDTLQGIVEPLSVPGGSS